MKKDKKEKKPSKITVSDVALVLAILNFLFVLSGIILEQAEPIANFHNKSKNRNSNSDPAFDVGFLSFFDSKR